MRNRCRLLNGLLLLLIACSAAHAEPWRGGGTSWYPFSYLDDQGRPTGISVEVVSKVMQQTGQQVEFLFYPANRLNLLLDDGRIDLNYADSPQWNASDASERFVYSKPYLNVREHLYFLATHPARNLPLERLQGLRIGMVRGYTYKTLDRAIAANRLSKVEVSNDKALLELLMLGRVDAIAMVEDVFDNQLTTRQLEPDRFTRGLLLSAAPLVIKLQREHAGQLPALNHALQQLIDSGEIRRIRQRYLTLHPSVARQ